MVFYFADSPVHGHAISNGTFVFQVRIEPARDVDGAHIRLLSSVHRSLCCVSFSSPSFLEKKGRGGMFSNRWFDKSVISDTRKTIRNTVESLRFDHMQQEGASAVPTAAKSSAAAGGASGNKANARGV